MSALPAPSSAPFPERAEPLEEVCMAAPRDAGAMLTFALSRRRADDARPVLVAAPRAWFGEHGRPYGPGLGGAALVLVSTATAAETLWTMEQGLRSGALSLVLGAAEDATLAQTRRLMFAARQGETVGLLAPRDLGGLSAAGRRWRVTSTASALDPDDDRAPGAARLVAELRRARGERPGAWMLEQDDETHRLRLADRLADLGQAAIAGTGAPSGLAA